MKIDRLIGILAVLQRQGQATMPYLARKFEVSRRTISRDIDALTRAGLPIVTRQGEGGGVSLMEGHAIDTTVFTREELTALLAGIGSLGSVLAAPDPAAIAGKLGGGQADDSIEIDLSSFYRDDLAMKIRLLRTAIRERRRVSFCYCSAQGEGMRRIEPQRIVYKWSDWYVFGFCMDRQDFRLFKLRRLWELSLLNEEFSPRAVPEEKKQLGSHMTDDWMTAAVYEPSARFRLIEEYGPSSFTVQEDGRLYAEWGFSSPEKAAEWFISFGDQVRVLAPDELVDRMRKTAARMMKLYEAT